MRVGEYYLVVCKSDLLIEKKTEQHERIIKMGIKPIFATWSILV